MLATLVAYLDNSASQHPTDTATVCGWLIRKREMKPFARQWARLHHGKPFHLTDYEARQPPYDKMSNPARNQLRAAQNDLITEYAIAVVGEGIEVGGLTPNATLLERYHVSKDATDPYALCLRACMKQMADWSEQRLIPPGRIAIVLEIDTVPKGLADKAFRETRAQYGWTRLFPSLVFQSKGPRPLEAADIVATESMKEARRVKLGAPLPREQRKSLTDLLRKARTPVGVGWISKKTMDGIIEEARELGLLPPEIGTST